MKIKLYSIAILCLLALIVTCIHQCNQAKYYKSEADRHSNNYNAVNDMLNNIDSSYAVKINLQRDEFDQVYTNLIDSLNKKYKLKIKANRVNGLNNIKIQRIRDTITIWRDSILPGDTIIKGKQIKFEDDCVKFSVYSPADSNIAMIRTELDIDTYIIVHKGKRSKQFKIANLPLFRYGKRTITTDARTNCTGAKLKIKEILIND
jgi:hypothetical protein